MNILLYAVGIIFQITITLQSAHIFSEKKTCEISAKFGKRNESFVLPAQIDAENDDIRVSVLLCTKDDFVPAEQTTHSKISLYDKTSLITQNSSDNLPYELSKKKEIIIINLPNNIKCTDLLNYTITIKLVHSYSKKPRLNTDIECEVEIEILSPDYNPPCKKFVDGKWFIDLMPLKRVAFTVTNKNGEVFNVSLCGPAPGCKKQAGCKIGHNETTVIGSLSYQEVMLDPVTNGVAVRSSIKEGRNKKTMLVYLKCNWNIPYISYPKILNEGSNFKFEVQSSFGCVKLPMTCIIKETSQHLTYDLRSLSNKNGTIVSNTSRTIRLNMCGDLQMTGGRNKNCQMEKSQVCEIHGNDYINRGSIPHFQVTQGRIRASFTDGQQCNVNETYSTIVDLICSSEEKGPIFVNQKNCLTEISWQTPKACPKFEVNTKSCLFYSSYGNVNLTELYVTDGFTKNLSRNRKLVYNICGKLSSNCSTSNQVSACLISGNNEKIIGWNEPVLSYVNGKLQLKYTGERCPSKNQPYSITINMICNYLEKQSKPVLREVDDCTFIGTISSSSACLKHWDMKNCTLEEDNFKYDLSPLIRGDKNYEIRDSKNRNRTYFFNLCAPVIPEENLLFHPNSMVSMDDSSVANIVDRFSSLGQVTAPIMQNGNVFVKLTGILCENGSVYSTKIFFECSNNEESQTILNNDACSLEIGWKTKHACPIMKKGGKCSLTDENTSIKVPGDPIEVIMDSSNTYYFSLCLEYYKKCTNNQFCVTKKLSKRIYNQKLHLNLDDSDRLKTVNLTVECDPYTFLNFSKGQLRNHQHLDLYVKTRISCDMDSRKTNRAAEQIELEKIYKYKIDVEDNDHNNREVKFEVNIPRSKPVLNTSEKPKNNTPRLTEMTNEQTQKEIKDGVMPHSIDKSHRCNIITVKGKTLKLNDLMYIEFKSLNATYIINFDGKSSKCGGLFCKNSGNVLSFIEDCPDISYGEDYVNLMYLISGHHPYAANSSMNSVSKRVEISLRCNHDEITASASENDGVISVLYSSPIMCIFSESSNNLTLVFVIVGLSVILILSFTAYVSYKKNYCRRHSYTSVNEDIGLINHKML